MQEVAEQPRLEPALAFPQDLHLPELGKLFDVEWVWGAYSGQASESLGNAPERFRVRQFVHRPGRSAFARYEVQWSADEYLPPQHFVVKLERQQSPEYYLYPNDRRLPGLRVEAEAESALCLVNAHVLSLSARRARVGLVRYLPGYRAVLRHRMGRVKLYARVARPANVETLLRAYRLTGQSGYVLPNLVGSWSEGGIIWLTEIAGENLRRRIRKGKLPNVEQLLGGLAGLWQGKVEAGSGRGFNLSRAYRSARRSFRHHLRDAASAGQLLKEAEQGLGGFVEAWQPSGLAHNDFYDDQLLLMKDGRLALVDFEETGLGDPLLDVGNFLAHLRWSARFGRGRSAVACQSYHESVLEEALARFGWRRRDLALREAVCLFRVCTNAIRHPQANWESKLEAGLGLVNEVLG